MKKFLSLVLALVMTMSLVTVSAGAKDFADDSDIDYKAAVDVISELGVVDGYSDDTFRPDGLLTRGAAAKIICNLILGPTTASALSASTAPFKDVPTTNVFAGYITYCAQQGIISGYGDGTFRPTGTLSGNAFMKMLLGALGYDSSIEGYTGANWQVNVIKQASGIGLDDGNDDFVGSNPVTRGEAALYAFNMLQATMVEYDQQNTIVVGDIHINTTSSRDEVVNTTKTDGNIGDADNLMQFAERYFPDLKEVPGQFDAFMRPAVDWRIKNDKIGTYTETPDVSYDGNVALGDIYSDLGLTSKITASVWENGLQVNDAVVSRGNSTKLGDANSKNVGNGTLVDVYYDSDAKTIDIIEVQSYVGTISKSVEAGSRRDAYVVVTEKGTTPLTSSTDEFETDEIFEDDQVVVFTYSDKDDELQSVVAAESVEGTMTGRATGKSVTIEGQKISFSHNYVCDPVESMLEPKNDYVVYLDTYGNAIYVEAVEEISSDFAFVSDIQSNASDAFKDNKAVLVFTDGEKKTVDLAKDYTQSGIAKNDIVTFRINEDGEYVLQEVAADKYLSRSDTSTFNMVKGNASVQLTYGGGDNAYANSKTIFVAYNGTKWNSYTGIKNAPSIASNGGTHQVYAYCATGADGRNPTLTYVWFISDGTAAISSGSDDIVFLAGKSDSGELDMESNEDYDYYEYNAVVNSQITTVKVAASVDVAGVMTNGKLDNGVVNGLFKDAEYDGDVIIDLTSIGSKTNGTQRLDGEYTIGLNSADFTKYTVGDDAEIYVIDEDGVIEAAKLSDIQNDDNDYVNYIMDSTNTYIEYLFVQEVSDGVDDNTPNTPNAAITGLTASGKAGEVELNATASSGTPKITVSLQYLSGAEFVEITTAEVTVGTTTDVSGLTPGQWRAVYGDFKIPFTVS